MFYADRVIIDGLTRRQGQPSRIWKVQYDWLSLGKGLLLSVEQALAGRNEIRTPLKIKTPARDRRLGLSAYALQKCRSCSQANPGMGVTFFSWELYLEKLRK